jgi:hypothetical protein
VNIVLRYPKVSLVVLILIWGLGYPVMKVGLAYCPPLIFAGLRAMTGGLVLAVLALRSGEALNFHDTWRAMLASLVFNVLLFFGTSAIAIKFLPSGIASILLVRPAHHGGRTWRTFYSTKSLTQRKFIGLLVGFIRGRHHQLQRPHRRLITLWRRHGIALCAWAGLSAPCLSNAKTRARFTGLLPLPFLAGGLALVSHRPGLGRAAQRDCLEHALSSSPFSGVA